MPNTYLMLAKVAGLMFLVATAFFWGVHSGKSRVQFQFDAYKQQQTILAQQQELKAKEQEAANERVTYEMGTAYASDLAHLRASLERMRKQQAASSSVPAATGSTQTANAGGTAEGRTCEGTEFYTKALTAELMLEAWQKWAVEQHIPVR